MLIRKSVYRQINCIAPTWIIALRHYLPPHLSMVERQLGASTRGSLYLLRAAEITSGSAFSITDSRRDWRRSQCLPNSSGSRREKPRSHCTKVVWSAPSVSSNSPGNGYGSHT